MATVVSITNPVTGAVEQVDKLDATAQQIDDAVALSTQLSNHNLLDNWYFARPVNQRGQAEYNTGVPAIYTIDRWRARNAGGNVVVEGDGVRVTCASTTYNMYFEQDIEPTADDMPVYVSALVTEVTGTVYMQLLYTDGTYSPSGGALKAGLKEVQGTKPVKRVMFQINKNGGSVKIKAAKLELGSQQTLAHQDSDGNWVLNEIPDYGEQLRRCQRYQVVYRDFLPVIFEGNGFVKRGMIQFPVEMRVKPAIVNNPSSGFAYYTISGRTKVVENTPMSIFSGNKHSAFLSVGSSGGQLGSENFSVYLADGQYVLFDANL